jgi:hypothetical protein
MHPIGHPLALKKRRREVLGRLNFWRFTVCVFHKKLGPLQRAWLSYTGWFQTIRTNRLTLPTLFDLLTNVTRLRWRRNFRLLI